MLTLAITGGTGFVGGHTLAEAVRRGHRVRALARRPQPARQGVEWVAGSLTDLTALGQLMAGADAVVHIAGVTNAPSAAAFTQGNALGTAFVRRAAGRLPLVHVSSLSAREPGLSDYGFSKYQGERIAAASAGPVVILRPPGVYGPGDGDFLQLLKTARSGLLPMPRGARTAMIHGADLAAALVALAEDLASRGLSAGGLFEIDDGAGHHGPAAMAAAIAGALGKPVRAVEVPPALLHAAALADTTSARLTGRTPRLSRDRARYMAHPDWSADSGPLLRLGLWAPAIPLNEGMAATAAWYRAQGLLP